MENPLVSVFMVTYNQVDFITEALEGVVNQITDFDFEVVIGDDFSTDGTREIVAAYCERYPLKLKPIFNPHNFGAEENSKNIFKNCSGKYIALCEGDDFWQDRFKLQKQVNLLCENKEIIFLYSDYDIIQGKKLSKNINSKITTQSLSGDVFKSLLKPDFPMICTSTVIFKNNIIDIDDIYMNIKLKKWLLGDLVLWLELSLKGKFRYLPESTSTYRLRNESASRTKDIVKKHAFHKSVYDIRYFYWEKYSKDEHIKKILDQKYYDMMIGDAYKMRSKEIIENTIDEMKKYGIKPTVKQKIKYAMVLSENIMKAFRK